MLNRNILVSFNGTETSINAAKRAAELAHPENSFLTLLYAHQPFETYQAHGTWIPNHSPEYLADVEERITNGVVARFVQTREALGLADRMEFSLEIGSADTVLEKRSSYFDLICLGQHRRACNDERPPLDPSTVARTSKRPVLQMPKNLEALPEFKKVALVWQGTHSCARALGDILALIPDLSDLTVLTHGKEITRDAMRALRKQVEAHDIKAKRRSLISIKPFEEAILQAVEEDCPDILAIGISTHLSLSTEFFEDFPCTLMLSH